VTGIRFYLQLREKNTAHKPLCTASEAANYKRLIFVMAAYEGSIRFTIMYAPV
jgi:hypothetical protein